MLLRGTRCRWKNGHELVLYDLHLSAYSSDGTIADEQLELLLADMQAEYEAGNYVVGGGDFNKDLLRAGARQYFGVNTGDYTWAQPIRTDLIEATDIRLIAPVDPEAPVASCRNADGPYQEGQLRRRWTGSSCRRTSRLRKARSSIWDLRIPIITRCG